MDVWQRYGMVNAVCEKCGSVNAADKEGWDAYYHRECEAEGHGPQMIFSCGTCGFDKVFDWIDPAGETRDTPLRAAVKRRITDCQFLYSTADGGVKMSDRPPYTLRLDTGAADYTVKTGGSYQVWFDPKSGALSINTVK